MNDQLLSVLAVAGQVKKVGTTYMALCPAHADVNPSVSINEGETQSVVLKCHAGCETESILQAWGLSFEDVSVEKPLGTFHGDEITAEYRYENEDGKWLYTVCRTRQKQFPAYRPSPSDLNAREWNLGGVKRILYRLPELKKAIRDDHPVWLVEGEKDVETLRSKGLVATTSPGGASAWRMDYGPVFDGAEVSIVADNDEPGLKYAESAYASMVDRARSVRILKCPGAKDITDHLREGRSIDELVVLRDSRANEFESPLVEFDRWIEQGPPPRTWLAPGFLERGDRTIITGIEGGGKSVLTRMIALCLAAGVDPFTEKEIDPCRVCFFDSENSHHLLYRFMRQIKLALNLRGRSTRDQLQIWHLGEGKKPFNLLDPQDQIMFRAWLLHHKPDLVVLGPLYRVIACNPKEEEPAANFAAYIDGLRAELNFALIIEGHATHEKSESGLRNVRPIGSSLWLRWPEMGIGLRPRMIKEDDEPTMDLSTVELVRWRPFRDDEKIWPRWIRRGGTFPWHDASEQVEHEIEEARTKKRRR